MKRLIIMLAIAVMASCATMQPKTAVEPDAAVAEAPQTKPVDAYVLIPCKAEDQEKTKATITGDDESIRWIPVKVTVNVPARPAADVEPQER